MDEIIEGLKSLEIEGIDAGYAAEETTAYRARRRLEECRALLTRLANDEPAPEGSTFKEWAGDLLK